MRAGEKLLELPAAARREKSMVYHVGFSKRGRTLVIEARRNIDFLSCELYDYKGRREVSKEHLKAHRYEILALLQRTQPLTYGNLRYAVVD